MKFLENIKQETKQLINWLASIVTIGNFLWSLNAVNSTGGIPLEGVPIGRVEMGLIASFTLEAFLATAFGWVIVYASSRGRGLPFLLALVAMLISAWTSLFNIQWLVLGHAANSTNEVVLMGLIAAFFCGFACYLIDCHIDTFKLKFGSVNEFINSINEAGRLYLWQIFCFVVMFVIISANVPY